jgi:hypothetical protein
MMMFRLYRMIVKSLAVRGLMNTVLYAAKWPIIIHKERRSLRDRNAIQTQFDEKYGTDTAGIIPLSSFVIEDSMWTHGVRYAPTSPKGFKDSLSLLGLGCDSYKEFTFVDVGSGKGATLLYASDLGFKAVCGIELVKELHEIAAKNISLYPAARDIGTSVCTNAVSFQMPSPPLVVFANYPISSKELMDEVVRNIANSGNGPRYLVADNFPYSPAILPSSRLRLINSVEAKTGNRNYAFEVI